MEYLPLMIPLAALAIPIAAIVVNGLQKVMRLRIEEARILHSHGHDESPELESLRDEVAQLREELDEVQERLDFAERALIQKRGRAELPGQQERTY